MWHATGLTRGHLKKIQKNHEMTRGTLLGWHVYI